MAKATQQMQENLRKKPGLRLGLGVKMLAAFLFIGLLPLGLLTYLGIGVATGQMAQIAKEISRADFEQILATTASGANEAMNRLSQDPRMINALRQNDLDLAKSLMMAEFQSAKLVVLELGDARGKVLFRAHTPEKSGDDKSKDPFVRQALSGNKLLNAMASGRSGFHIRSIVPIQSGGTVLGTLQVGIDFSLLAASLESFSTMKFAAIDGANTVLYSNLPGFRQATPGMAGAIASLSGKKREELLLSKKQDLYKTPDGRSYQQILLPFYDPEGKLSAVFAVFVSDQPMAAATKQFIQLTASFAGILLIVIILYALAVSRAITKPMFQIRQLTHIVSEGDYTKRAQVKTGDELEEMAGDLNKMLDRILAFAKTEGEYHQFQQNLKELLVVASRYADGDLTVKAQVTQEQLGVLGDSFNIMADGLRDLINQVKKAGEQVQTQSGTMEEVMGRLAQLSGEEAKEIQQVLQKALSLSRNAEEIAGSIKEVEKVAVTEAERARTSADAMAETTRSMEKIRENIQDTSKKIKKLGEDSLKIGEILESMNEMARKTNLLAINAAIEANAAGEAGRSFAIVAQEVKKLSDASTQLTAQIDAVVGEMINSTKEVGASMEESINEVVSGSRMTQRTSSLLKETVKEFANNARVIQEIARGASEQSSFSREVSAIMERLNSSTQETYSSMEETIKTLENLSSIAKQLQATLKHFKVA